MYCNGRKEFHGSRLRVVVVSSVFAVMAAGCSADIMRFDPPVLGFKNQSGGPPPERLPADDPLYAEPAPGGRDGLAPDDRPEPLPSRDYSRTELPPASVPERRHTQAPFDERRERTRVALAPEPAPTRSAPTYTPEPAYQPRKSGEVTVQAGDTLYGLARRHGVSVAELKAANGLTTNVIQPGQTLSLHPRSGRVALDQSRQEPLRRGQPPRTVTRPITSADENTYTVQPGDSLYAISRQTGVRVAALKSINNIADARRLRPGTVLNLREGGAPSRFDTYRSETRETARVEPPRLEPRGSRSFSAPVAPRSDERAPDETPASITEPRILNPNPRSTNTRSVRSVPITINEEPTKAAGLPQKSEAAPPPLTAPASKFRWPAKGRIVRGFGLRPDGTKNDGVDIAVPFGADVHAAESGVVAYAGDELQGYGNLVLIRHEGGWVTAYAHNEELLVKRGDTVARGQVIAKAGKTGNAKQPVVHFELRQGAKPVDPLPHLAQL
jgi:murein DD-endopeptidase MepM/ murein hydrolase activator NlpD